jgi:hypothetical protein
MSPAPSKYHEPCYGVDIDDDGSVVVAEYGNGVDKPMLRFPAGTGGAVAVRERVGRNPTRARVCIRSSGSFAFGIAVALMALPSVEVALIAPRAAEHSGRARPSHVLPSAEERAQSLAQLAKRFI